MRLYMTHSVHEIAGVHAFECAIDGPILRTDRDAIDVLSEARSANAQLTIIPVERLDPEIFSLKTRLAAEFLQKFVTYGMRIAIMGEIPAQFLQSVPLRAFVLECNRGRDIWFVGSHQELKERLLQE